MYMHIYMYKINSKERTFPRESQLTLEGWGVVGQGWDL